MVSCELITDDLEVELLLRHCRQMTGPCKAILVEMPEMCGVQLF
jgi:hypothetical protein